MNMKNLSVRTRIYTLLLVLGVLLLGVGLVGLSGLDAANGRLQKTYEQALQPTRYIATIAIGCRDVANTVANVLHSGDPQTLGAAKTALGEIRKEIVGAWEAYQKVERSPDEIALADKFWELREAGRVASNKMIEAFVAGHIDEARRMALIDVDPITQQLNRTGNELFALQAKKSEAMLADAKAQYAAMRFLIVGAIVGGLLLAGIFGVLLARSIIKPLSTAVSVSSDIANGGLGHRIEAHGKDELVQLLRSLQSMDDRLSEVVNGVRSSADAVAHAATELSVGNDDLSQRTQEQASALQQTAASMEQMTTTVKRNADNADRANQLAASARSQAMQGATVVQDAVAAMEEINGSSGRIAEIISVIDEIAFQTNLLALNAAVEAARAGEQGRGFAVVATEVRNLAQRSAAAAKQSKELINESVSKVKNGASLVDATGEKLQQIKDSVNKVCDIVAEIAAASAEQASGISQVNHAITQMDQTTQQNAALVEEAAAASKGLQHRAQDFIEHVSFFRSSQSTAPSGAPVAARPAPSKREPVRAARAQAQAPARAERPAPQRVAKVSGGENWEEF